MFDDATVAFIRQARSLDGLDLQDLPQRLTDAYSKIVTARLRAAAGNFLALDSEWEELAEEFRRIATTFEALTLLMPTDHSQRASTAFVSAAAHHGLMRAEALRAREDGANELVDRWSVSPKISAALLYAIGGHQSDSAEVAKELSRSALDSPAERLVDAIAKLLSAGSGDLFALSKRTAARADKSSVDVDDQAVDELFRRLYQGVILTAQRLLGTNESDPNNDYDWVLQATSGQGQIWETFSAPGVRHLCLLLKEASETLTKSSVVSLPPPSGVPSPEWERFIKSYARSRPLLWRNHRAAIADSLLDESKSAVLSFPTGAGKSALAELRTATEHLRGKRVVYLVPTRALASQVRRQISDVLRPLNSARVQSFLGEEVETSRDYDVAVMTPEACLALLGADEELISDVGLVIFDECHLMSGSTNPEERPPDRRAVDASLALLGLMRRYPEASLFLISAMISNAQELSSWIQEVTERPCQAFVDPWKPTRQVRGALAYRKDELNSLKDLLRAARQQKANKAATERSLTAYPIGLFCNKLAWDDEASFHPFQVLDEPIQLGMNKRYWSLTANRNKVAAHLAAAFIRAGIRPLVFAQNITHLTSAARDCAASLDEDQSSKPVLNPQLIQLAELELGAKEELVECPAGLIGLHHSLMLPPEREATEAAYRQDGGLVALFATPTLAQGMNLPAEVVIIAGDNRWEEDEEMGQPVTLPVPEILNAAGRAGRAGMFAQGLVFLIPAKVYGIIIEDEFFEFDGLKHVESLLGSPDQCLRVVDPLIQLMDQISKGGELSEVGYYFLQKIRHEPEAENPESAELLRKSFGFSEERWSVDQEAAEQLIQNTISIASNLPKDDSTDQYIDTLARTMGVSPVALKHIYESLPPDPGSKAEYTVEGWADWLIQYLAGNPTQIEVVFNLPASGLTRIFKTSEQTPGDLKERMVAGLSLALPRWLSGQPLNLIQPALYEHSGRTASVKQLGLARRFHNETGPALGATGYLIRRLALFRAPFPPPLALHLDSLPGCLSRGFDHPAKLALNIVVARQRTTCRVEIHELFKKIEDKIPTQKLGDKLSDLVFDVEALARSAGII